MLRATGWVCVLAVLSACGASITDPIYTAAKGTLTAAAATEVKTQLESAAKLNLEGIPSQVPTDGGTTRFYQEFGSNACVKKTPEATTDVDTDGIFATRRVDFSCTDLVPETVTAGWENKISAKGYSSVLDKDDNDKQGGFRYEFDMETTGTYKQTGISTQVNKNKSFGFFDLTKTTGGGWIYSSNYKGGGTEDRKLGARADEAARSTYEYGSTWNHTLTPDGSDATIGAITFAGFYGFTVFEQTGSAAATKDYNYVLKATSEGLTYDTTSCTNFYSAGSITFEDAAANKVVFTYTCSAVTKTFNGTGI